MRYPGATNIVTKKIGSVNLFPHNFSPFRHILSSNAKMKRGAHMKESDDYSVDLDDLIFDEEDGRPSEH